MESDLESGLSGQLGVTKYHNDHSCIGTRIPPRP